MCITFLLPLYPSIKQRARKGGGVSLPLLASVPSAGRIKGIKHKHELWTDAHQLYLDPNSDSIGLVSSKLRNAAVGRQASAKPMTGM